MQIMQIMPIIDSSKPIRTHGPGGYSVTLTTLSVARGEAVASWRRSDGVPVSVVVDIYGRSVYTVLFDSGRPRTFTRGDTIIENVPDEPKNYLGVYTYGCDAGWCTWGDYLTTKAEAERWLAANGRYFKSSAIVEVPIK